MFKFNTKIFKLYTLIFIIINLCFYVLHAQETQESQELVEEILLNLTTHHGILPQENIRSIEPHRSFLDMLEHEPEPLLLQTFVDKISEKLKWRLWGRTLWWVKCTELTLLNLENIVSFVAVIANIEIIKNKQVYIYWRERRDKIYYLYWARALCLFLYHAQHFKNWTRDHSSWVLGDHVAPDFNDMSYPYIIAAMLWAGINGDNLSYLYAKLLFSRILSQFGEFLLDAMLTIRAIVNMVDGFRFWQDPEIQNRWGNLQFQAIKKFFQECEITSGKSVQNYPVLLRLENGELKHSDEFFIEYSILSEMDLEFCYHVYATIPLSTWLAGLHT